MAAYTSFAPFLGFVLINIFGRELGWFSYQRLVDHNVWYNAPVSVDWVLIRMVGTAIVVSGLLWLLMRLSHRTRSSVPRWGMRVAGVLFVVGGTCWVWASSGLAYLAQDVLRHLTLPVVTVILPSFGETMMLMRMSMLETTREEYVLTARAVGYPENVIREKHVARNAIMPVLTRLGLNLPFVLVGSLVVERVFLWSAMGQVVFNAVEFYDVPMLLGVLSVVGVLTMVAHVVLDVVHVFLDPRLRYAEGS